MIVVLDGPAGAGKSSAAKLLAARLSVSYLDTGAMYRAFTLRAMRKGVPLEDVPALVRCVDDGKLEMLPLSSGGGGDEGRPTQPSARVVLDGEDVSEAIRSPEVTRTIFRLADSGPVRARITEQQRSIGRALGSFVAEGRDLGTVVFPDATVKIYLDASSLVRAKRRLEELRLPESELEKVRREIEERDRRDMVREVAPLKKAADAIVVDTSDLPIEAVVSRLEKIVRERAAWPR